MGNGKDGEGPEARRSARVSKMFSLAKDTKAPEKQFKKLGTSWCSGTSLLPPDITRLVPD